MRCAMFRDGAARVLVFRLGVERFAVELAAVDEVLDAPPLRRVPDAPPSVLGIATIRGEMVTMYDTRAVLGVDGALGETALLFKHEGRRVGLTIEDVDEAFIADESELRSAPGSEASSGMLMGVIRRGRELVAVLDAGALVDAATSVTEGQRT